MEDLKEVKLIASDMDHTLLTQSGELPPGFYDYVARLNALGIDFVIASGRPLYTLEQVFDGHVKDMCFISDNGALVTRRGEILFKSLLPVEEYQTLVRFTLAHTDGFPVICGLDSAYMPASAKPYETLLRQFLTKITFSDDITAVDVEANKFTIFFPNKNSQAYFDSLYLPQFGEKFSVTIGDTIWIDMMNKGIHKGFAMHTLGELLGITTDEMMAFGDTYNDIEMLQTVKYSYLVQNAHPDMRQYARFTADSNENYGVLKVLAEVIAARQN